MEINDGEIALLQPIEVLLSVTGHNWKLLFYRSKVCQDIVKLEIAVLPEQSLPRHSQSGSDPGADSLFLEKGDVDKMN